MAYRAFIWRHNNPEKRTLQKRIEKTRRRLRTLGILPPVGVDMDDRQKEIYQQLGMGDFSYWDTIKKRGGKGTKLHNGGTRINQQKKEARTKEYMLWDRLRGSAKKSKRDFDITVEDIVIPECCPYLGIELSTDINDHKEQFYFTGDRIDSTLGYVKGNVQVISFLANAMKNNSTEEQLITFAKNILRIHT